MNKITQPTREKDIKRDWKLFDVNGKILGRAATEIAQVLMGKGKPYFAKNMDCGDYVVVINAKEVKVTGNKEKGKVYKRFSGYPGGLRKRRLEEVRAKDASEIVTHAVSGMLPKNKLRASMLKRLYVFEGSDHKYQDKFEGKENAKASSVQVTA